MSKVEIKSTESGADFIIVTDGNDVKHELCGVGGKIRSEPEILDLIKARMYPGSEACADLNELCGWLSDNTGVVPLTELAKIKPVPGEKGERGEKGEGGDLNPVGVIFIIEEDILAIDKAQTIKDVKGELINIFKRALP